MPTQNVTNNNPGFRERLNGVGQKLKSAAWNVLPQGLQKGISGTKNWLAARNLHPGNLLLGSALSGYFAGSDLASGKSVGQVIGENAGFWAGNQGFLSLMKRLPNFTGKGAVSMIGSFMAGIPASIAAGSLAEKYAPIHRFATPAMEQYGQQLMQKTSARIASKYNYWRNQ